MFLPLATSFVRSPRFDQNGTFSRANRLLSHPLTYTHSGRLLEYAADYYDVKTFPQGETRRALERVMAGKSGKSHSSRKGGEDDGREKKKRKKDKSGR